MAIYSYVKAEYSLKKKVFSYFSYFALTVGAMLLFWAFYPVVSFEIYSRLFIQRDVSTPVPQKTASAVKLANSVLGANNALSNNLRDFTQASLWFPKKAGNNQTTKIAVKEYQLSIPKLNIDKAKVLVGGEDLAKSLVHYLPTTLPGESGNVVVFGHSTLPQLYNVSNYKTIFTYLPSLEDGDKVLVRLGDENYEYEVFEMFVVKPDQVSVLDQKYDDSYLTLITCVPPGTYWNRLVVRAKLVKYSAKK